MRDCVQLRVWETTFWSVIKGWKHTDYEDDVLFVAVLGGLENTQANSNPNTASFAASLPRAA